MSNPVDDYLESCPPMTKKADLGGMARGMLRGARGAFSSPEIGKLLMQTGAVAGVTALAGAARKAYNAATKSTDYKMMLDVNPDLVESQQTDPKMFNQYYNSLRSLNPTFAADPVVAGSYMRQMTENPYNAGNILVNSMGAAPRIPSSRLKDYATGLSIAQLGAPPSAIDELKLQEQEAKLQNQRLKGQQFSQGPRGFSQEEAEE